MLVSRMRRNSAATAPKKILNEVVRLCSVIRHSLAHWDKFSYELFLSLLIVIKLNAPSALCPRALFWIEVWIEYEKKWSRHM